MVGKMNKFSHPVAEHRHMAVTTFDADGTGVVTAGRVADLGDGRVGFATGADPAIAARLDGNPEVVVVSCSRRGVVASCAPQWHATAWVASGSVAATVRVTLMRRFRMRVAMRNLIARFRRRPPREVLVVVELPPPNGHGNGSAAHAVAPPDQAESGVQGRIRCRTTST
jgi:PPOX class probable F420-dependent enzyme